MSSGCFFIDQPRVTTPFCCAQLTAELRTAEIALSFLMVLSKRSKLVLSSLGSLMN